jgi:uncharacterized protein YndB with AHSA1/START domain
VFRAWTDPELVVKWWGPNGFTNTIHQMDVRPGSVWSFVMHGPDGTDYQNKIIYEEVLRPERLVYSHVVGPRFRMTVTLQELDRGEKTGLTANMVFESNEDYKAAVERFHAVEGLTQTLS